MMRRVGLVALHVFKENIRDRVLYSLAGFAVALVAASIVIAQITAGQDVKIIKDLGLATIELVGVLIAVFIGVGLVAKEIDRRSIYGLLSKPLHRREFILGKYLGLLLTLAVNVALMTAALYLMLAWMHWASPANLRAAWDAPALDPRLLIAIGLIYVELALITAIALFFSTFSSSALLSTLFTLGLFVAGQFTADLTGLSRVVDSAVGAAVLRGAAAMLPAFSAFNVKDQIVHGEALAPGFVVMTTVYGGVYAAALVGAAMAIFSRREFK